MDDEKAQQAVQKVVESLEQSNPRAYKSLMKSTPAQKPISSTISKTSSPIKAPSPAKKANSVFGQSLDPSPKKLLNRSEPQNSRSQTSSVGVDRKTVPTKPERRAPSTNLFDTSVEVPDLEEAVSHCATLDIPQWDEPDEDEGGILVGIQSTKWQSRHSSIKSLAAFVGTRPVLDSCSDIEKDTVCMLVLVKEHTRGFKESNMNVSRSILELFLALSDYHEKAECPLPSWACTDGTSIAVEKISDRKLSSISKSLLMSLCVVHPPHKILLSAFSYAEKLRAPSAHEEFLVWMKSFCNEFGASAIGPSLNDVISFLKVECASKNVKVKRAAFGVIGVIHSQIGPSFKAISVTSVQDPSLREEFEKTFIEHPYDPSTKNAQWPKCYIFASDVSKGSDGGSSGPGLQLELPKLDLLAELPSDCISRMGSKDGKTAWKARKAALEDLEKALKGSSGLIDTSKMRPVVDLLRALKERLSDSQSNLKPVAARLIGSILGSVEGEAQGKLGKVVYASLINGAMNDNRKIMNDASMEALRVGTSVPAIQGEGLNEHSLEPFIVALTSELEESEFKAAGIAGILELAQTFVSSLSDLDKVASQRGETLGSRFAGVLVDALTSSKAEIRSAAESLLSECLSNGVFAMHTVRKCTGRLVPAKQRSVGVVLAKIASEVSGEEEKDTPMEPEISTAIPQRTVISRTKVGAPKSKAASVPPTIHTAEKVHKPQLYEDDRNSAVSNPLVHEAGPAGNQKARAAMRSLTWPEYPEEPSGSLLYLGLKKAWAPLIPPEAIKKLFPDGGIRKQDDAMAGFELLTRAIALEKAGEGMAVTEQLPLILRWSVFVMSCKESTVGLSGLLDMLSQLISYLRELNYELSDSETMLFIPFLMEKASVAKGRFKDTYMDLINLIKADHFVPLKRLGPFVCVAIMESSSQSKARLLACQDCYECVESIGLSGIGKKGVLVVAKSLIR